MRTVHLGRRTVGILERWRSRQAGPDDGWIVSHDGDTPMRAKALGEAITRLGKKLGIKVTTRSFRRTSSTQMVAARIDVDTAARRSGHTREVIFAHYVQGTEDKAVEAALALEDRLIGQGMAIEGYLAAAQ